MTQQINQKYSVITFLSAIPVFVYFLFFVGRVYSEAYLRQLGIPFGLVNYDFIDYVYFGAHMDTLFIALTFTSILMGLVWYVSLATLAEEKYRKADLILSMVFLPYWVVGLTVVALITIFNPDIILEPAMILFVMLTSIASAGFILLLLTDKGLIGRIKRGKHLSRLFMFAVILTLICFPYMFSSVWASFKAYVFPYKDIGLSSETLIEMTVNYPLVEDINWEAIEGGLYNNVDRLYLVLSHKGNLFVKTDLRDMKTYIIKSEDLVSYQVRPLD